MSERGSRSSPQLAPEINAALATPSLQPQDSHSLTAPRFLIHRNQEIIHVCCFQARVLGVIYYTAIENLYVSREHLILLFKKKKQ